MKITYLAGGCFWLIEKEIRVKLNGILEIDSGFIGEGLNKPNYEQVKAGKGRYREAIRIKYNENQVTFKQILDFFFNLIDPFDEGGQLKDRGFNYTTAVYYQNENEKQVAEQKKSSFEKQSGKSTAVAIESYTKFNLAEEYHQKYFTKHPIKYWIYQLTTMIKKLFN